jgi:hypothetical protein
MKEKSSLIFFTGKYQLVLKYFPIDEIKMCFPTEFKGFFMAKGISFCLLFLL